MGIIGVLFASSDSILKVLLLHTIITKLLRRQIIIIQHKQQQVHIWQQVGTKGFSYISPILE